MNISNVEKIIKNSPNLKYFLETLTEVITKKLDVECFITFEKNLILIINNLLTKSVEFQEQIHSNKHFMKLMVSLDYYYYKIPILNSNIKLKQLLKTKNESLQKLTNSIKEENESLIKILQIIYNLTSSKETLEIQAKNVAQTLQSIRASNRESFNRIVKILKFIISKGQINSNDEKLKKISKRLYQYASVYKFIFDKTIDKCIKEYEDINEEKKELLLLNSQTLEFDEPHKELLKKKQKQRQKKLTKSKNSKPAKSKNSKKGKNKQYYVNVLKEKYKFNKLYPKKYPWRKFFKNSTGYGLVSEGCKILVEILDTIVSDKIKIDNNFDPKDHLSTIFVKKKPNGLKKELWDKYINSLIKNDCYLLLQHENNTLPTYGKNFVEAQKQLITRCDKLKKQKENQKNKKDEMEIDKENIENGVLTQIQRPNNIISYENIAEDNIINSIENDEISQDDKENNDDDDESYNVEDDEDDEDDDMGQCHIKTPKKHNDDDDDDDNNPGTQPLRRSRRLQRNSSQTNSSQTNSSQTKSSTNNSSETTNNKQNSFLLNSELQLFGFKDHALKNAQFHYDLLQKKIIAANAINTSRLFDSSRWRFIHDIIKNKHGLYVTDVLDEKTEQLWQENEFYKRNFIMEFLIKFIENNSTKYIGISCSCGQLFKDGDITSTCCYCNEKIHVNCVYCNKCFRGLPPNQIIKINSINDRNYQRFMPKHPLLEYYKKLKTNPTILWNYNTYHHKNSLYWKHSYIRSTYFFSELSKLNVFPILKENYFIAGYPLCTHYIKKKNDFVIDRYVSINGFELPMQYWKIFQIYQSM